MTTQISARIIEDSVNHGDNEVGNRLTTYVLTYPRFIHSELMTHRVFSRNASSSRAIPVAKMLKQVWSDPAMPVHWGKNQPGMQADSQLTGWKRAVARWLWRTTGKLVCVPVWVANKLGLHKQIANRLLEPWQWIHVVLTATEFANWFELRNHKDAQPEINKLALELLVAMRDSTPRKLGNKSTPEGWHLPFVTGTERLHFTLDQLPAISAARCARVSYLTHEGLVPSVAKDLDLFDRLVGSSPRHASPVEHQACAAEADERSGNFLGFTQYRKLLEVEWSKQDHDRNA